MNITKLMPMKSFYFFVIKHLLTKHSLRNTTPGHIFVASEFQKPWCMCRIKNKQEKRKGNATSKKAK